jgi:hypothetical protein
MVDTLNPQQRDFATAPVVNRTMMARVLKRVRSTAKFDRRETFAKAELCPGHRDLGAL